MRTGLIIAGILLIAVGAAAFTGNLNFTKDKQVLKIGELSASVQQEKSVLILPWDNPASLLRWTMVAWASGPSWLAQHPRASEVCRGCRPCTRSPQRLQ